MLPEDGPIGRDLKTETGNVFGNITGNPNQANLMSDPHGTEIVAGLSGPTMAQSLPTDETTTMNQPPQVEFDGGAGGVAAKPDYTPSDEDSAEVQEFDADGMMTSLMDRIKNLPAWGWLLVGGAAIGGAYLYRKK